MFINVFTRSGLWRHDDDDNNNNKHDRFDSNLPYAKHWAPKRQTKVTQAYPSQDVNMTLWHSCGNQGVHADREIMANRRDKISEDRKKKEHECWKMWQSAERNVTLREAEYKLKYRNLHVEIQRAWNVGKYVHLSNTWSHQIVSKSCKEIFHNRVKKTFNRLSTEGSYTWNITHCAGNITVWNVTLGDWLSPLVQGEKYQK